MIPNAGLDGLNRETVVRDWDWTAPVSSRNTSCATTTMRSRARKANSKPKTSTLISAVEGNSLQYFNTVFDSAAPDADGTLVNGPYNGADNVMQGNGVLGEADRQLRECAAGTTLYLRQPGRSAEATPGWKPTRSAWV